MRRCRPLWGATCGHGDFITGMRQTLTGILGCVPLQAGLCGEDSFCCPDLGREAREWLHAPQEHPGREWRPRDWPRRPMSVHNARLRAEKACAAGMGHCILPELPCLRPSRLGWEHQTGEMGRLVPTMDCHGSTGISRFCSPAVQCTGMAFHLLTCVMDKRGHVGQASKVSLCLLTNTIEGPCPESARFCRVGDFGLHGDFGVCAAPFRDTAWALDTCYDGHGRPWSTVREISCSRPFSCLYDKDVSCVPR